MDAFQNAALLLDFSGQVLPILYILILFTYHIGPMRVDMVYNTWYFQAVAYLRTD